MESGGRSMDRMLVTPPAWSGPRRAPAAPGEGLPLLACAGLCCLAAELAARPDTSRTSPDGLAVALAVACVALGLVAARALARLRAARRQLETLRQAAPGLLWIAERDGRTELLGEKWTEFGGRPEPELEWQPPVFPEDLARFRHELAEVVRGGAAREFECRFRRTSGEAALVCVRVAPVKDALGRVARLVGLATERSCAQERAEEESAADRGRRLAAATARAAGLAARQGAQ